MPDHDKPESTPDYASMFSNFLPGPSQPPQAAQTPQVAQTPASNPASPQPPKNETETDDFLANIDKMTKEAQWEGAHAEQLKAAKMHLKVTGWTEGKTEAEIDAKAREVVIQKEQEIESLKQKRLEQLKKNKKKILVILVSIVGAIILISILYAWAKAYDARILKQHAEQTQLKPEPQPKAQPMPAENLQNETQQAHPMLAKDIQPEDIQPEDIQPEDIQPKPQQEQQAPQIPLEDPAKILARLAQKNRLNIPSSAMKWASVESGLTLPILKTAKSNDIAQALSTYTKKRCQTIDSKKILMDATDIKLLYCVNPNGIELDSDANFNTVWHQTFHAQTQDNVEFIEMYLSFAPSSDKSARIYKINHDYATVSEFRDVYGGDGEGDRISFKIYDIAPISWLDTQAIRMRIISDVSNSNETTGCFYENEHKNLHSYIFAGTKFRPVADWLEISVTKGSSDCEGQDPTASMTTVCQNAVLAGTNLSLSKEPCQ